MPTKTPKSPSPLYDSLRTLLDQLDQPAPATKSKKRPGRPAKHRAATAPVILHLYKSQIRWLDDYADLIHRLRPDNARLSRVEIVRGLLLGLARHALDKDLHFPTSMAVESERDLQYAIALALNGGA